MVRHINLQKYCHKIAYFYVGVLYEVRREGIIIEVMSICYLASATNIYTHFLKSLHREFSLNVVRTNPIFRHGDT
jgi:hypothetical protein